jgi:DNA-binding GntR family transcriptional regulator
MRKIAKLFVRDIKTGEIRDISDFLYFFEEESIREIGDRAHDGSKYEILAQVEDEPIVITAGTNNFGNISF